MSFLLLLAATRRKQTVVKNFTANTAWPCPPGVTVIPSITGKGAAGTPSDYSGDRFRSVISARVVGAISGSGSSSGTLGWGDFQELGSNLQRLINAGNSGFSGGATVSATQYPNGTYSSSSGSVAWSEAIPGSCNWNRVTWKTSGPVVPGDDGTETVNWREYGTFTGPTTGASTTGFGKVFPGGSGGPATSVSFQNIAVVPGTVYNLVIPAGGSLNFTYQE